MSLTIAFIEFIKVFWGQFEYKTDKQVMNKLYF